MEVGPAVDGTCLWICVYYPMVDAHMNSSLVPLLSMHVQASLSPVVGGIFTISSLFIHYHMHTYTKVKEMGRMGYFHQLKREVTLERLHVWEKERKTDSNEKGEMIHRVREREREREGEQNEWSLDEWMVTWIKSTDSLSPSIACELRIFISFRFHRWIGGWRKGERERERERECDKEMDAISMKGPGGVCGRVWCGRDEEKEEKREREKERSISRFNQGNEYSMGS